MKICLDGNKVVGVNNNGDTAAVEVVVLGQSAVVPLTAEQQAAVGVVLDQYKPVVVKGAGK